MQILGDGLISLGIIRKFEIRGADFVEYPLDIPDGRVENREVGEWDDDSNLARRGYLV